MVIAAVTAGGASAAWLRQPAWAKPLIAQLEQAMRPHQTIVSALPVPALPPPTVSGFTCYVAGVGAAIAMGAVNPCDRPAIALPILSP